MSKPALSVVIASYNDPDIANTVKSIRETAGNAVEIVVVDDCSAPPVPHLPAARVVRNSKRVGCGPSRYIGACLAEGEYLLICDSHMRFPAGWFEAAMPHLKPQVLHCASCVGLGKDMNPNVGNPYFGATWNFCGPDRNNPRLNQVLECVWAKEEAGDEYRISAIMGACYFIHREWFIYLNALRNLRLWGGDEQELSLKAWLSGGEIRFLKSVRIGHKFREGKVSGVYVMPHHIIYNKLFIAHTCLPPDLALRLQMKMQKDMSFGIAMKMLREDWHMVETSRAYNASIFKRNFKWLIEQFQLSFPEK